MVVVAAVVVGDGAAVVEAAAGGRVHGLGYAASDFDGRARRSGRGNGHGGEQGASVGVLGVLQDALGFADFDYLAEIHYRDAVAHVAGEGEVVGDVRGS